MNELKSLGKIVDYKFDYNVDFLEAIPNNHVDRNYFVHLVSDEFTCVCPITHQPDFATIKISYIPDKKLVESKSLKLYLTSFRNHGTFHEDAINHIADDLIKLLQPRYLEVEGIFKARGGIAIVPYVNYACEDFKDFAEKRLLNRN
ncbi:MAG: preQ(1) synthase [Selenomonadaceae bacterium]|nr:preQ(1) synthase [Selenomonadaceae bacterium]